MTALNVLTFVATVGSAVDESAISTRLSDSYDFKRRRAKSSKIKSSSSSTPPPTLLTKYALLFL